MTVELLTISLYRGKPNMYFYYCLHYLIKFVMIYKCKIFMFPKRIISRCIMHSKSCGVNRTSTIKLNLNIWSCDSYNLYLSRIHCFLMHHNCAWHIVSVIRVMYSLQVDHVSWQKRQRLLDYCNIIVLNSMVCFICDCVPIISLYLERFCLRSPYSHCYIEDRYIGVLSHTFYCNFCRDIEYSSLHREH